MKKLLFALAFFLFELTVSAQVVNTITGKWFVQEVIITENLPKQEAEKVKELISAFEKSSFSFEADGKFSFDLSFPGFDLPDGVWWYDATKPSIKISESRDPGSILMVILIEKDGMGNTFFLLDETPIKLKVKK